MAHPSLRRYGRVVYTCPQARARRNLAQFDAQGANHAVVAEGDTGRVIVCLVTFHVEGTPSILVVPLNSATS